MFVLGVIAAISGSLIKMSGNKNADLILAVAVLLHIFSILGFLLFNYKRIFNKAS